MSTSHVASAAGGLLIACAAASAADLRFGADGLPYLARNATLVVEVESSRPLRSTPEAQLLEVRTASVLKGSATGPLLVVVPLARDVPVTEMGPGATLFLRPYTAGTGGSIVPANRAAFETVSGGIGVIKADASGSRQTTVREYVALAQSDQKLEWAKRNLGAEDPYVQRSAMLEMAEPSRSPSDPALVQALADCLRAQATKWDNKGVAVNLLAQSRSEVATRALDGVARDLRAPTSLRLDAVQAISGLPGGAAKLREYRVDPVLAPRAKFLLERRETGAESVTRPQRDLAEVRRLMSSTQVALRKEGAAAAADLRFSPDVVTLLRQAASTRESSSAVQLAAVESLARLNRRESAVALAEVARDAQLPKSVRAKAVLGIARIESGAGQPVLRQLAATLQDEELRKLAKGLAAQ